jgi:transcriptional regulator with XRE-family HTH domain
MTSASEGLDRRTILPLFQQRLRQVLARSELSQTDFAAAAGIDRSTLSQLLAPGADRLPRVESIAAIAHVGHTSLDWLLGLSQGDKPDGGIGAETLQIERDAPSPLDERLLQWHREAAGYRIRHIPTSFPDLLKTDAVIEDEYGHYVALGPRRRRRWRLWRAARISGAPCPLPSGAPSWSRSSPCATSCIRASGYFSTTARCCFRCL